MRVVLCANPCAKLEFARFIQCWNLQLDQFVMIERAVDLTLQRYMAATEAERAEIDQLAGEKAKPALARVGEDKHAGIMEQAKIEAAREYFSTRS